MTKEKIYTYCMMVGNSGVVYIMANKVTEDKSNIRLYMYDRVVANIPKYNVENVEFEGTVDEGNRIVEEYKLRIKFNRAADDDPCVVGTYI